MKHLKRYNESTSDDIVSDLRYMLLDISDDFGYLTHVGEEKHLITVTISRLKSVRWFVDNKEELNSMKEVLNRIEDYGKSCGYLVDRTWIARINNLSQDEFNKRVADNKFYMYITMFPKNR